MAATSSLWPTAAAPPVSAKIEHWYALHTRWQSEKLVAQRLAERGVESFLPTLKETHRWSDRNKLTELPLFSCYVFARFAPNRDERLRVLRVAGVLALVGSGGEGTPIPDEQIDSVRRMVEKQLAWSPCPFLKIGQRVRVRGGALDGIEGILASRNGTHTLVITVDAIQRSLAVRVDGYQVLAA